MTAALPRIRQNPSAPDFVADPYAVFTRIHALGGTVIWEDYDLVCVARHDDVDRLLRDRRFGRESPLPLPDPGAHLTTWRAVEALSLLEREPPEHTRLRSLVNRAFVSRAIGALAPRIAALAHELIDAMPVGRPFDLIAAFCEPTPVLVIADLLGVPRARAAGLRAWSAAMVAMYRLDRTRAIEEAAEAATRAFVTLLEGLIDERTARPRDDLLTHLVIAHGEQGRLDRAEIVSTAILLLNAGHEATVHALANAVHAVLTQGVDPGDAFADDAATGRTIEEALRFDPPLHLFTRYALEPVEVAGARFAPGDRIGLLLAAAGRDPGRYPEPDRFDPARAPRGHLGFGAGLHFCVGAPLARLEMAIALPLLFRRIPGLVLAAPAVRADRWHFRAFESLPVIAPAISRARA